MGIPTVSGIVGNLGGGGGGGGGGGLEGVAIATAHGFAGTSDGNTTTATITLTTTVTGVLKGDGTTISAATAGTDYQAPIAAQAVGSSPNANGVTISGANMTLEPADGTHPGLLTAAAQTIGGVKAVTTYSPPTTPAALAIDWSTSNVFVKSISGSSTFTFSNTQSGQTIVLALTTTGAFTATFPTAKWPGGAQPTQTASGTDVYTFIDIGGTIYASVVQAMA